MSDKNQEIEDFNKTVLSLLERIKELYEEKYPDEYKVILQGLTTVSKKLNYISVKEIKEPYKIKTDENNTSNNGIKM